jgi:uracil-DNA glycosylase
MNKEELKKLNFSDLLKIDHPNIEQYSFEDYANNGFKHPIIGMCTKCEEEKVNICPSDKNKNCRLKNMGHGSMTDDILTATGQKSSPDWKKGGVLFVLENPGPCDNKIYTQVKYNGFEKFPSQQWHFVNPQPYPQRCEYPYHFKGGEYGELFCSILFTFKLENMYITDVVKCGMIHENGEYLHINTSYDEKCIEYCLKNYLYKEIQLVNPEIIFCLGGNSHKQINKHKAEIENLLNHRLEVEELPHPNTRSCKTSIEFRDKYYHGIIDGLFKSKIISEEEKNNFLERRNVEIEDPKIKLEEIGQFLKENGFNINKPHNNYFGSKPINGISFFIHNNESILSFHWGNEGNKKFDYEWFKQKNNEISKKIPNTILKPGEKNPAWFRLYIPVSKDHYKESILEIINKTKEIMEYQ